MSAYFNGPDNGRSAVTGIVARRQNAGFALRLPREMRRELKRLARRRGESEAAVCREAVRVWLDQQRKTEHLTSVATQLSIENQTKSA